MSRNLKFALSFLAGLPLLALAAIGLLTVGFVARVGLEKTYDLSFQALNQAIGIERVIETPAPDSENSGTPTQARPRKKLYPEAVGKYDPETGTKASEKCLEVVDDPDRLLECIRKSNSGGDALKDDISKVDGRSLDTADLPLFDPSSPAAMRIRDNETAIDYVNVKFSTRNSKAKVTTKVRFQKLPGGRFLVLAGHPNTEWRLDGSTPKDLTGILILTRGQTPKGRILGVPEGVPVSHYALERKSIRFPFIAGIIPKCREREGGSFECVNGPRNLFSSRGKNRRTPFQIIDDWAQETLGQRLSTVSSLNATQNGLVVVPKEIVTQATRETLERELAKAKLLMAETKVKTQRRQEYEKRWRAERFALATADLTERPPFSPSDTADRAESIVVASIYETLTKERRKSRKGRNSRLYDSYADYKARADQDVRPVSIRIDVDRPIVLILTSHAPVNWIIDIARPEMITAVHIEGFNVSGFSGVPKSVPVRLRPFVMGHRSAVHFIHPKDQKTEAVLNNFRSEFADLPVALISNYRADSVNITNQ